MNDFLPKYLNSKVKTFLERHKTKLGQLTEALIVLINLLIVLGSG